MSYSDNMPEPDEFEQAYEEHREGIYEMLIAYADKHELSDGFLSQLASDICLSLRMVAYASETEKPSAGGLRLDLERFAREITESVREAKKSSNEFIAEAKAARAEADAEGRGAPGYSAPGQNAPGKGPARQ